MNIKKILILFVTSVILISCVFTEELHIKNDGSGSYAFKMDMSEMIESMKGMSERDTLIDPEVLDTIILFKDILSENKDSIAKLDHDEKEIIKALEDFKMRMQIDEEKGLMLMTFGLDFKNISELKNMEEKIAKAQSLSDKKKSNDVMPSNSDTEYSFDGNKFKRIVTLKNLSKEKSAEFDKMIKQSSSFLEGSNYRLVYHFDNEIEHVSFQGARISEDKKTMIIEMPMDTIIKNPKLLDFEVTLKNKVNRIHLQDLGTKEYKETWDIQEKLFDAIVRIKRKNKSENLKIETPNHFLFVEHPHVYTLGKSGDLNNLLLSQKQLEEKGITFHKINRGGDITYHGFGQIVGYPILDLDNFFNDIHKYMRFLEEAIIQVLAEYGLKGQRSDGETGVWLDVGSPFARKICALGVRSSRWVTMHGFALNVNTNLGYFDHIIPCGIRGKAVTSLEVELGKKMNLEEVKEKILKHFAIIFEAEFLREKIQI